MLTTTPTQRLKWQALLQLYLAKTYNVQPSHVLLKMVLTNLKQI